MDWSDSITVMPVTTPRTLSVHWHWPALSARQPGIPTPADSPAEVRVGARRSGPAVEPVATRNQKFINQTRVQVGTWLSRPVRAAPQVDSLVSTATRLPVSAAAAQVLYELSAPPGPGLCLDSLVRRPRRRVAPRLPHLDRDSRPRLRRRACSDRALTRLSLTRLSCPRRRHCPRALTPVRWSGLSQCRSAPRRRLA
jgi:hypothetical protein